MNDQVKKEIKILKLDEVELENKRVFVRVDFNVPLDRDGNISEDSRIRASLPTLQFIMEKGGRLIIASHLGRPKAGFESKFSLKAVAMRLEELLGKPVRLAPDCVGGKVEALVDSLEPGHVIILENIRFHKEEEQNDPEFSRALARLSDVYVNDAFGTSHRAHASTEGMTHYVPSKCAGFLLLKELEYFQKILEQPEHPLLAILGGAKVSDKIGVLNNLIGRIDALIIGGAMAYTFLKAQGIDVGKSLLESDKVEQAGEILKKAKDRGIKILLPQDHIITDRINPPGEVRRTESASIPPGWIGVDIGPRTVDSFSEAISGARTIFWNGPLGMFEVEAFAGGTMAVARVVAKSSAISVIGGGDSVAAVKQSGLEKHVSHLSTGGGASLEWMEGKTLPGIAALAIGE